MTASVHLPVEALAEILSFVPRRQRAKLVLLNRQTAAKLVPRLDTELKKLLAQMNPILDQRFRKTISEMNTKTVPLDDRERALGDEAQRLLEAIRDAEAPFALNKEKCQKQINTFLLPIAVIGHVTRLRGRISGTEMKIEEYWQKTFSLQSEIRALNPPAGPNHVDNMVELIEYIDLRQSISELELKRYRLCEERFELGVTLFKTKAKLERVIMVALPEEDHQQRRALIEHYESVAQQYAMLAESSRRRAGVRLQFCQLYGENYERLAVAKSLCMEVHNMLGKGGQGG